MAQKRMFDRSIMENDKFMDLPMSSKALYFLLGMEADDEGFVSPKRVMRIYGGSDDDLKILIVKEFVIQFQSGVVVITDRNENNKLDIRRIKETKYQKEKSMLLVNNYRYSLSIDNYEKVGTQMRANDGTSIEECIVVENRIMPEKKQASATPPIIKNNYPEHFLHLYKSFPHVRGDDKKKSYQNFKETTLTIDNLQKEINLLCWQVEMNTINSNYIPAFERWIRKVNITSDIILQTELKKIVYALMNNKDPITRPAQAKKLVEDYGQDIITKYRKEWSKGNSSFVLRFTDDNGNTKIYS